MKISILVMSLVLMGFATEANAGGRSWDPPPPPKPKPKPVCHKTTFTGGTISCTDAKVTNGPILWSYVVKSTASLRLGSDVLYNDGTNVNIISSLNVAQYGAGSDLLYMMVDDINEKPTHIFAAVKVPCVNNVSFAATLQLLSTTTGKVTSSKTLKCTVAQ